MKRLGKLAAYIKKYKTRLIVGSLLNIVSVCFAIVTPLFIKKAIDSINAGTTRETITWCALAIVFFALLRSIFIFSGRLIVVSTSRFIERDIRNDVFNHLTRLKTKFYDNSQTGEITSRVINDIENIRMMIGMGAMVATSMMFTFIFSMIAMFYLDARLAAIAMIPLLLIFISVAVVERKWYKMSQRSQEKLGEISNNAQENYSGIRVVKSFNSQDAEVNRFKVMVEDYKKINTDFAKLRGFYFGFLMFAVELSMVVMLLIGGSWIINGSFSLGNFMAFTAYQFMLIWPMMAMGWLITLLQRGLACSDRVNELLNTEPEPSGNEDIQAIPSLEFKNLSFSYNGHPVLKDLNLSIRAGEKIAIVGKTGCGKTTLANLILKMYLAPDRSIFIDGKDVNQISTEKIRELIAFVPQDNFLFQDTVTENIRFGATTGLEQEKIAELARIAKLSDDVDSFANKYEQIIGERGVVLSGGQKQRLSIARALARNPQLILLDDAFSNIDANTEKVLLANLKTHLPDRTVILITHRFSTVRDMDRILVMADGKIVEDGKHDELLKKRGHYFELFEKFNLTLEIMSS